MLESVSNPTLKGLKRIGTELWNSHAVSICLQLHLIVQEAFIGYFLTGL
jgi:hypothetical protein